MNNSNTYYIQLLKNKDKIEEYITNLDNFFNILYNKNKVTSLIFVKKEFYEKYVKDFINDNEIEVINDNDEIDIIKVLNKKILIVIYNNENEIDELVKVYNLFLKGDYFYGKIINLYGS
jgi:hypothetical protein